MKRTFLQLCVAVVFVVTMVLGAATAMAQGRAQFVSNTWKNSTTYEENFNFGNVASTDPSKLPQQVQSAITVGTAEALVLGTMVFGIF